jgi:hypothetical protein
LEFMSRSAERPLFSQCGPPFRAPIIFSRASTFPWAAGRWRHCRRAAPWSIRLGGGLLSGLDASPEPLFGGEKEVLIKGVRGNKDLDPFASACDDGDGGLDRRRTTGAASPCPGFGISSGLTRKMCAAIRGRFVLCL